MFFVFRIIKVIESQYVFKKISHSFYSSVIDFLTTIVVFLRYRSFTCNIFVFRLCFKQQSVSLWFSNSRTRVDSSTNVITLWVIFAESHDDTLKVLLEKVIEVVMVATTGVMGVAVSRL